MSHWPPILQRYTGLIKMANHIVPKEPGMMRQDFLAISRENYAAVVGMLCSKSRLFRFCVFF